ncbi:LytTR family DNA-binding domain-containing protein [Sagittula sp. SSi028]|uniref:LytTR family DNA-binding domain-containing protein n=1 Tax=Sagittula sp. SSi028 TaxID=3400636 RepID=UPI003AF58B48
MQRIFAFPLSFVDSFGGRSSVSLNEYVRLLCHRDTQIYVAMIFFVLVATDAPGLQGNISFGELVFIWALAMATFLFGQGFVMAGLAAIQLRTGRFAFPDAGKTLLSMVPSILLGEVAVRYMTDGAIGFGSLPQYFFYYIVCEIFLLIYVRYIMPNCIEDEPDDSPEPEDIKEIAVVPERQILIGANPVALKKLHHMQAQEHHVHVVLSDETMTHRARLSDIIAQTENKDGIQPHRSWWVAAHAARDLQRTGGKHVLVLNDGTQVPVARSRVAEVQSWLEEHSLSLEGNDKARHHG